MIDKASIKLCGCTVDPLPPRTPANLCLLEISSCNQLVAETVVRVGLLLKCGIVKHKLVNLWLLVQFRCRLLQLKCEDGVRRRVSISQLTSLRQDGFSRPYSSSFLLTNWILICLQGSHVLYYKLVVFPVFLFQRKCTNFQSNALKCSGSSNYENFI